MGLPWTWGAHPSDPPAAADTWTRAVDVRAPVAVTFRWLCQLRAAPYSYDLLDNLGRRSPSRLIPGLEDLAVGQRALRAFRIEAFDPGRSITFTPAFGRPGSFVMTYFAVPGPQGSRIVVHATVTVRHGRRLLAWGDLVMMRHQLRRLARLAARLAD